MESSVVNELNTVLKGEQMAVDAYDRFIEDVDSDAVKDELKRIQRKHSEHADEIAARIRAIGGKPDYNTGFAGFMASAKAAMQGMTVNVGTIDILKQAYDGEDKGIAMAREIVKGDLDSESAGIIDRVLTADTELMRSVVNLIADIEEKH
ncbi:MAG TPA: DUF2383 domain-containing protein [Clostridia bacterium]|nr:DUF2383 domain-containing protein [Clostridia bacterium]